MALTELRTVPLLSSLSDGVLEALQACATWSWHQPGEVVLRQGESVAAFFLVAGGSVELVLEGDVRTRIGLLAPGDFFGELSVLTGDPAPFTVVAADLTTLVHLTGEGLHTLLEASPELSRKIITTLANRVKEAGAKLHRTRLRERSLADHITRQGARSHPEWVGSGAWSQRLRAAIARTGATDEPAVIVGEAGSGKELVAARVHYNSQRKDGPFIVLDGAKWSEQRWAESLRMAAHGSLLIKHAHLAPPEAAAAAREVVPRGARVKSSTPRLLATAPKPDDRHPSPLEEALLERGKAILVPPLRERREDIPQLVRHFLRRHGHDVAMRPISGEALRKLESYPFLAGNVRELERVVQEASLIAGSGEIRPEHLRLSGRQGRVGRPRVAVALGGGVVRGCAHIGVLQALAEAGIPVDFVVGTSSGSLIGALYTAGMSIPDMKRLVESVGWFDLTEPTWPRGGFLTSHRMRSFLDRQIGRVTFADLKIPFAAVAADANSGQSVILQQGLVADAVRASTAIPGLFRPVEIEGRFLVDGVVVNNVPASVARAMGADLVIAVDVTQYNFAAGAPRSVGEALMRAFDISARQAITASLEWADVVIRPHVAGLNGFSFKSAPAFVERGYAAGREAVGEIHSLVEALQQEVV